MADHEASARTGTRTTRLLAGGLAVLAVAGLYLKANVDSLHADKRQLERQLRDEHDQTRAVQAAWCASIQDIENRTNWAVMPDQYAYLCGGVP